MAYEETPRNGSTRKIYAKIRIDYSIMQLSSKDPHGHRLAPCVLDALVAKPFTTARDKSKDSNSQTGTSSEMKGRSEDSKTQWQFARTSYRKDMVNLESYWQ